MYEYYSKDGDLYLQHYLSAVNGGIIRLPKYLYAVNGTLW